MFRFALFSALLSNGYSSPSIRSDKLKGQFLSTARRLEGGEDISFLKNYGIKFQRCYHTMQYNADGDGGNNGNFINEDLVKFRICPERNTCSSDCDGGAEYVVDLKFFVDAFTEAQMEAREYACEMVRESCGEEEEEDCYVDQYEYCKDEEGEENFNVQEYLECNQYDIENENDGNDYYVGPHCSNDGYSIHLGLFTDEECSTLAEDGTFYELTGYELEYSSESVINANECARCNEHALEQDKNGGDDEEDEDDVIEQCEELYQGSARCEEDLDIDNPNTDACGYIENLDEQANRQEYSGKSGSTTGMSTGKKTLIGLVVSILAVAVLLLACYVYAIRKRMANKPKLSDS